LRASFPRREWGALHARLARAAARLLSCASSRLAPRAGMLHRRGSPLCFALLQVLALVNQSVADEVAATLFHLHAAACVCARLSNHRRHRCCSHTNTYLNTSSQACAHAPFYEENELPVVHEVDILMSLEDFHRLVDNQADRSYPEIRADVRWVSLRLP
jgi:hypothetical protein